MSVSDPSPFLHFWIVTHTDLHKERLQQFVFGGGDQQHTTKEAMEHLVLEEELELQLNLLKDDIKHSNPSTLFPQVEEPMAELPHLKDASNNNDEDVIHAVEHAVEDAFHHIEHTVAMQEPALLEETNLETIAMCAVVLALALIPEMLQLSYN